MSISYGRWFSVIAKARPACSNMLVFALSFTAFPNLNYATKILSVLSVAEEAISHVHLKIKSFAICFLSPKRLMN